MIVSKTATALSIAVALSVLGVGGAAYAAGKHKPIQTSTTASSVLDALAVQHKDPDWHHMNQSWCDVDPKCNGWDEKMKAYEGKK